MSRKLLLELNGGADGALFRWLAEFPGEPRIAWYPSAGEDFRDLLYLHPRFSELSVPSEPEPEPPDIFIHTDYLPWSFSRFLDSGTVYSDHRTSVNVKSIEELPPCDLPLDPLIVDFPEGSQATGRVVFMELIVTSNILGTFQAPVLYAFVENAAFCAERILQAQGRLSHVIHVRFGGGCGGGGKSTGIWLLNVLRRLRSESFVTDGHYAHQSGDERVYARYPELSGNGDAGELRQIRVLRSEEWSGHGDVSWNLLSGA